MPTFARGQLTHLQQLSSSSRASHKSSVSAKKRNSGGRSQTRNYSQPKSLNRLISYATEEKGPGSSGSFGAERDRFGVYRGPANQFRSHQARSRPSLMKKLNTIKSADENDGFEQSTHGRPKESIKIPSILGGSQISADLNKKSRRKSTSKASSRIGTKSKKSKAKSKKASVISSGKSPKKLLSFQQYDAPSLRNDRAGRSLSSQFQLKKSIASSSVSGSRLPPVSSSKHIIASTFSKGGPTTLHPPNNMQSSIHVQDDSLEREEEEEESDPGIQADAAAAVHQLHDSPSITSSINTDLLQSAHDPSTKIKGLAKQIKQRMNHL